MSIYQIEYMRDRTHVSYLYSCSHFCTHFEVANLPKTINVCTHFLHTLFRNCYILRLIEDALGNRTPLFTKKLLFPLTF